MTKKNSKTVAKRKPRKSIIGTACSEDICIIGIRRERGAIVFENAGTPEVFESAYIQKSYERPRKGDKVIIKMKADPNAIQTDPNLLLRSRFASLFAVDTGYQQYSDELISIAASAYIKVTDNGQRGLAEFVHQDALVFHGATVPPERLAWGILISGIVQNPNIPKPVGIIVDSDLDQLEAINSKQQPIVGNFYLPDDFELIFATTDAGTREFYANAAIEECHKVGAFLFRSVLEGRTPVSFEEIGSPYFSKHWLIPVADFQHLLTWGVREAIVYNDRDTRQ